uniref:Transcriptional modulator of MazE/toxin, MazF n=1 Tax=Chlorobium chlorochromatii (strain CaD3) TaxID=340177 RepID=Q3ASD0_CHLCH
MSLKRGDLVTVALQGAYGKPRPALVIQANLFAMHPSVTILPVTSELRQTPFFRIDVEPSGMNNLKKRSQIMIDKVQSVPREKVGAAFGTLDDATMVTVNRALALWLGFA